MIAGISVDLDFFLTTNTVKFELGTLCHLNENWNEPM